jgi:hypothetical protein
MKRNTVRKRFIPVSAIGLVCIIVAIVFLVDWFNWYDDPDKLTIGIVLLMIGVPALTTFFVDWAASRGIDSEISELSSSQPIDMKEGSFAGLSEDQSQEAITLTSQIVLGSNKIGKRKTGSTGAIVLGAFIGFIAMIFFNFIPVLGPILAGFIAGLIAGHGAGRGLLAGFLAGIAGAVIVALLVTAGFGFFGSLLNIPIVGTLIGGAIGTVILIMGLYNGFLGLIGGAIGGTLRK